jgi:hypothetical protein
MLTMLVFTLPLLLGACASYAVHLYSDPQVYKVIDERLVLTEAEVDGAEPFAVVMRGDSVVVIGERRNNWEYEQNIHERYYVVYFGRHRAYVPYRSLVSQAEYASMYGQGRQPDAEPAAPPNPDVGPGRPARDTTQPVIPGADNPTGNRRHGSGTRTGE